MAQNKKKWKAPVQKNEQLEGEVIDLTHEGLGVVRVDHYPLFVEGALPGETIQFKVIKVGKKFGFGRLEKVLTSSPQRVDIVDKVYAQTGTMPLQHLTYEAQLNFKKEQVEKVLEKIAKLPDVKVEDVIGMEEPYGYRNKAQVPVRQIDGKLTTGFFRKNSHDVIPIEDFVIQDPEIDQAIIKMRDILRRYHVKPYNEKEHKGWLRHIVVRRGRFTKQLMVVLVTRTKNFKRQDEIVNEIKKALPELVSLIHNTNSEKTNVILGKESKVLIGDDNYQDTLFDFTFNISHQSFYQVNPIQTEKLYRTAVDFADFKGDETVIDAYSGIGTMTLALAQRAKHVYGMEIVEPAVDNAKENAKLNEVENVTFEIGTAEKIIIDWADEGKQVDAVVVDPPRKGLAKEFVEAVLTMKPEKMVYVSCNPSTLARDLKLLHDGGYEIKKVQPVDMFPQTTHIETVVLLSRM